MDAASCESAGVDASPAVTTTSCNSADSYGDICRGTSLTTYIISHDNAA